jgi:hypothetical protein
MFIKIQNRYINLNSACSFSETPESVTPANLPKFPGDFNAAYHHPERKNPASYQITLLTGDTLNVSKSEWDKITDYLESNLIQ